MSKKILICFGTRPEYIKVKSLIDNLPNVKTCFTGQHKDLLQNLYVDYELNMDEIISVNRLNNIICNILKNIHIFEDIDYVLIQGDTTTALAIAISAFNNGIQVIHLESGLRSCNLKDPYPEEANRQLISRITNIHFCPTEFNKENLLKENVQGEIYVVGNTGLDNINKEGCEYGNQVLITMHRRDNHDKMEKWFEELERIANKYPDIEFLIPLHPNPNVQKHCGIFNKVKVVEPMSHNELIKYVKKCRFVISDSGGLQEECSFLNKKIIVCRKTTERPESIGIHSFMCDEPDELEKMVDEINNDYEVNTLCPYGDGKSWVNVGRILYGNSIFLFNGHEGSSAIMSYMSNFIDIFGFEFFEYSHFDNYKADTIEICLSLLLSKQKDKFFEKLVEYKYNKNINDVIFPLNTFACKIRYCYITANVMNVLIKYNVNIYCIQRKNILKKAISIYDGQLQFCNDVFVKPRIYCCKKINTIIQHIIQEKNDNNDTIQLITTFTNVEYCFYEDFLMSKISFYKKIFKNYNNMYNFVCLTDDNCYFTKKHSDNLREFVINYDEILKLVPSEYNIK